MASRRGQKGKVLAVFGILISLLVVGGASVAVVAIGKNAVTLADPGCTTGKKAILDNGQASGANAAAVKTSLQATIDGLNSAATKARNDDVRNAMKALADDYTQLLQAVNSGTAPPASLGAKTDADAKKIDSLCTLGGDK